VQMLRDEERERVRPRAREHAEDRLLDVLLPPAVPPTPMRSRAGTAIPMPAIGESTMPPASGSSSSSASSSSSSTPPPYSTDSPAATRESLRRLLREGKLDDRVIELDLADAPQSIIDVFSGTGMEEMVLNLKDMLPQGGRRTKRRKLTVPEALDVL